MFCLFVGEYYTDTYTCLKELQKEQTNSQVQKKKFLVWQKLLFGTEALKVPLSGK